VIFSLFFFQISMWFGFAMGYAYHYGFFSRIDCGSERATRLESRFPFNRFADKPYFITAGSACGGEITASFSGPMGGMMGSARESNADTEAAAASANPKSNF